jgi:methionyl-tRNA formyltransferase
MDDIHQRNYLIPTRKPTLRIKCEEGWLNVLELQLEGKKRMSIS